MYTLDLKSFFPSTTDPSSLTLGGIASVLTNNILIILGISALFVLIFSGYSYITSAGDKNKVEQSSRMITNTIIGLVIAFSIFLIASLVGRLVGFNFFNPGV